MRHTVLLLAVLGFASSATASSALAQGTTSGSPDAPDIPRNMIAFSTEAYPPFSYQEPGGNYRGVGIDQVDLMMHDVGLPFSMEIMPWARAITLAENQPMNCVFAAARTPERESRFKWVLPLFIDHSILVRHAGTSFGATTLDDAKHYTIGTQREDYTEGLLKSMGFPKIDLSADIDTTLRKLIGDRIDMMPMSQGVYEKLKANGTPIDKVMAFSEQHLGIACNKDMPDDLIGRMQAALTRLIKDGDQAAILKRYGIDEQQ